MTKNLNAARSVQVKQELHDAEKSNDTLGIAQLREQKKIFYIPAGTEGLVLDTEIDAISSFGLRRKVRNELFVVTRYCGCWLLVAC